jgi:bifunctional UDP-N-acetylglucosamine pyrophosphorylase/glucosamine-1-phosphate N-acetyltransferase
LLGKTKIGARCTIGTGSVLRDTVIGDDVVIRPYSALDQARVASHADVGPFARLRPGADIRAHAHIGNFVEVKNAVVHEGAKAGHLTYIGDATVGKEANIGAGTITCNYDGVAKHHTEIGAGVFIVAAGSTITENVPAGALGIARGRQTNKAGWAEARRKQRAKARKKAKKRR